jgi:hypothetical protein
MNTTQHPDGDELLLYALEPGARPESVCTHVRQCETCQRELAEIQKVLAVSAMAAQPFTPPAGAKERLLQAAGVTIPAAPIKEPVEIRQSRHQTSRLLLWTGWAAAAACLIYAMLLHNTAFRMSQLLGQQSAELQRLRVSADRAERVLAVLNSAQAQRVTLVAAHAKPEPAGQAVYLPQRGALIFTASNLAPLPPNKTYELWIIPANGSAPVPAGTFTPDARGMASVILPPLPRGIAAKAFGVTQEKSGGSTTPTLPILLAGG